MSQGIKHSLRIFAGGLLLVAFKAAVAAQCAMCRASLSGSNNAKFIKNLNIGVLVLLTPPVAMFCAAFVFLKRQAKKQAAEDHD